MYRENTKIESWGTVSGTSLTDIKSADIEEENVRNTVLERAGRNSSRRLISIWMDAITATENMQNGLRILNRQTSTCST